MLCPKCGSDQVLNDQCLKCGVVVTKYKATTQSNAPVSFVSTPDPPRSREEYSYSLPQAAVESQEARKKSKQKTQIVTLAVVAVLIVASYSLYSFLRQRASRVTGMYKNLKVIFVIKFPEPQSDWFHYGSGEADSIFETAEDAFYKGGDPDDPEVAFGAWVVPGNVIPERLDEGGRAELRPKMEDDLLQRLEKSKIGGALTSSGPHRIGDFDGFRFECDLEVDGRPWKLIALRGQHLGFGHWFYFAGPIEMMERHSEEVEQMIQSLDYRTSVI